jgi:hypothetical protein
MRIIGRYAQCSFLGLFKLEYYLRQKSGIKLSRVKRWLSKYLKMSSDQHQNRPCRGAIRRPLRRSGVSVSQLRENDPSFGSTEPGVCMGN